MTLEVLAHGNHLERHIDSWTALHGDDTEGASFGRETLEHVIDPRKRGDVPVDAHVVLTVDPSQLVGAIDVELLHLCLDPVPTNLRHQDVVGNNAVEHGSGGVLEGRKDQITRIDECSVQVEENGPESHRARCYPRAQSR